MKPTVRIRLNANGAEWFNPMNRQWIGLDEKAWQNVMQMMYDAFGV